jgi:hypothetical protein
MLAIWLKTDSYVNVVVSSSAVPSSRVTLVVLPFESHV